MIVYIVMIDAGGVKAFQLFARKRWEELEAEYNLRTVENSLMLFKIALTDIESNMVKAMITNKKYMVAANMLTNLRLKRSDVV